MVRHTINIPDETNDQVQAVLGDRSMDDFAAEALRRHACREQSVKKLLSDVQQAEASGRYDGSIQDLADDMDDVIEKARPDRDKA